MAALSNAETILISIPMIGTLLAGFLRLDELIGRPAKPLAVRRSFSYRGADGVSRCIEPDGRVAEGDPVRGMRR